MARQLWLLRHGEAESHDARPDLHRRLTARGERQSHAAGEALARLGLEFDTVFTSPRVRALDTARLVCVALGLEPVVHEPLSGGFQARDAVALTEKAKGPTLLVGHEPDLSQIVADLTGGRIDLKKGGLAGLGVEGGSAALLVLLRPREVESLAEVGRPDGALPAPAE
ncbi:MAG: histidine phosphatase family protein [Actinobacteria bacterium]|nr:MAG: histidine phosphatase family protein [Actinomycetota bacterium]